jgi:phage shock protein PspC (stress-responsive transcriptional regulator)
MNDVIPTTNQPQEPPDPPERPRRLLRSSSDRVIAGVAGGLGKYFGVDPVMFRIGFVIAIFFGGVGFLAYGLLWLFVKTDGEPDRGQRIGGRLQRMGFWRALGTIALVALAIGGLFALAVGAAFAVAVGWGVPVAIAVIAIGAVLAATALRGRRARWLIAPALALVIGGGTAQAYDLDFRGGIGDHEHHPLTAASIPTDGYKLGIGRLVVDLRDLDWTKSKVVHVNVKLGSGQANVFVPERVCVQGKGHVGIGESEVAGERDSGIDIDHTVGSGSSATPRLELDADVEIGQLRVINSDTASVDRPGYGPGEFHEDTAPLRAAEARTCAA